MITVILGLIIGGFIGYLIDEWLVVGLLFGLFIGLMVAISIGHVQNPSKPHTDRSYLANLQDNAGVEGHFFLGTGTVGEDQYYAYYKQTGTNEFQLSKLKLNESLYTTRIVQDNPERPYVETVGNVVDGNFGWFGFRGSSYSLTSVTFHIPTGSITNQYSLDAK